MGHLAWCCVVKGLSLGMGRLHAMCWSSVTLSAKLGKVVLEVCISPSPTLKSGLVITLVSPIFFPLLLES